MAFGKDPPIGPIQVVLFDDHYRNPDNPFVTDAVVKIVNHPLRLYWGLVYVNQWGEYYIIVDHDGVNLLGQLAYYI